MTRTSIGSPVLAALPALSIALGSCSPGTEVRARFSDTFSRRAPVEAVSGDAHCDHLSLTYLRIDEALYAGDPEGLIPERWRLADYRDAAALPADAVDSGYRSEDGSEQVWMAGDETAIFIVDDHGAEQWPRIVDGFGCD